MIVLLAFAFVSGVITILSPCILPVLPIVLSGGVGGGRARPFGVLAGFVVSFTAFTLSLSAIVQALGIPVDALRIVAVVLILLFGVVMLVPWLRDRFEMLTSRLAARGNRAGSARTDTSGWAGFGGGVLVGLSLGLIWTPCVGPIMASVISLALTQHVDGGSVFITLAYTVGTSIPMLGVMLGGRALLDKVPGLKKHAGGHPEGVRRAHDRHGRGHRVRLGPAVPGSGAAGVPPVRHGAHRHRESGAGSGRAEDAGADCSEGHGPARGGRRVLRAGNGTG